MSQTKRYPTPPRPTRPAPQGRPGSARPNPRPAQAGSSRPRPEQRRPVQSAPARPAGKNAALNVGDKRFSKDLLKIVVIGIVAVIAALLLQTIWPDGFPISVSQKVTGEAKQISEIHSAGPIRISEVMTANRYTLLNSDDESSDWIEIANVSGSKVNIGGWELSKTANSAAVFTFPSMELAPGECVIVYADSRLRENAGQELHAPFRISSGGDTLMLFNPTGTAVDTVNIPPLNRDESYVRKGTDEWVVSSAPTPGLENTDAAYAQMRTDDPESPVILTEVMPSNSKTLADENGQYNDYIELYNRSNVAVSLSGWYLSDNDGNARKWRFPDVTIDAGETLVVFASGLDKKTDPKHLHTNFGLSGEGEAVILSDPHGRRMSSMTFSLSKADQAWVRAADGSWSIGQATPGTN